MMKKQSPQALRRGLAEKLIVGHHRIITVTLIFSLVRDRFDGRAVDAVGRNHLYIVIQI